ncbi:TM2 domain-containing protein biscotti [Parasteatoda tepidariorum]|uniref:TM2 domain-containing protein biscotti n=1 Tax=Parasteatoda tepidariorum TaxID=114398 RepID=UPI00077F8DA2|nr:TM2 domain-containing protein CG10795 [Parasteatoda tepidariorum]
MKLSLYCLLIFLMLSQKTFANFYEANCSNLLMGQYLCLPPDIDPKTQQPWSCQKNNLAKVLCRPAQGIKCRNGTGLNQTMFERDIECQYTNGYSYETALLLSLFLGMFGFDRFYLGYYAIGLAKLCTLGFMFLGQLVDIILIALQVVGPADGSHYIISYFGPKLTILKRDNETFVMPQDDW